MSVRERMVPRWFGYAVFTLAVLVVALATLTPTSGAVGEGAADCALLCGARGLADFIANIILFIPLGVALAILGVKPRLALALALLASAGIELAQISLVAGRDANPFDVLGNGVGGWAGAAAAALWGSLVLAPERVVQKYLLLASSALLLSVAATGILLSPVAPSGSYSVLWTQGGESYAAYPGEVLQATIGRRLLPHGHAIAGDDLEDSWREGLFLRIVLDRLVVAPGRNHIFSLEAGDLDLLFLGMQYDDLVLHYRSLGARFRLDAPSVRLDRAAGALPEAGAAVVEITRGPRGFCIHASAGTACPEFTAASGWVLIRDSRDFSTWVRARVNGVWIFLLAFPLGLLSRRNRGSFIVLAATATGLVLLPLAVGLAPLSVGEAIASLSGILAGAAVQWWAERRKRSMLRGS